MCQKADDVVSIRGVVSHGFAYKLSSHVTAVFVLTCQVSCYRKNCNSEINVHKQLLAYVLAPVFVLSLHLVVFFGPGNGATNVVLLNSLRLCRFSTDRNETFNTLTRIFCNLYQATVADF